MRILAGYFRANPVNHRGFTLVELIVVVVLVALVGATVAAKIDQPQIIGADDQLLSAMRYAQKVAVASRRPVYVLGVTNTDTSASVYLCWSAALAPDGSSCAAGEAVPQLGGSFTGGFVETLPYGVQLPPLLTTTGGVAFNSEGCFGITGTNASNAGTADVFCNVGVVTTLSLNSFPATTDTNFNPILIDSATGYARYQN